MVPTCDACRAPIAGPEDLGQSTADTVLCAGCLRRAADRPVFVATEDDEWENDPTPLESDLGIPHQGGEG